ncbi:MAG: response regulator [Chloroflexi bacterium]|nr:response regulator [Chloroflexota bacterium]
MNNSTTPTQSIYDLNGSVLIIENDNLICNAINDILTSVGMQVLIANDGLTGETMYRQHQQEIDMVILDLRLPRQNGSVTLRHIREVNPNVNVMISSGHSIDEIEDQLGDQRPVTILSKPFNIDTLLNQVQKILA